MDGTVSLKDTESLTPSIYECDLIWDNSFAVDQVKIRSEGEPWLSMTVPL